MVLLFLGHVKKKFKQKSKWIPTLFSYNSSFKVPALDTLNEVDRLMKDSVNSRGPSGK